MQKVVHVHDDNNNNLRKKPHTHTNKDSDTPPVDLLLADADATATDADAVAWCANNNPTAGSRQPALDTWRSSNASQPTQTLWPYGCAYYV